MRAVALLSGGLDSTVAAALHRAGGGTLVAALFVDYGQRAAAPERAAARAVAAALEVELHETRVPLYERIGGRAGALVARDRPLPRPDPDALDGPGARASAAAVWVPNRNGVLVNLAAALAEALDAQAVVVGFNAEEAATFADNGPRFVASLNACLADSTRNGVRVVSPTIALGKPALLAAGRRVGAPIERSWSCYDAGPRPCGTCESCRRRARAEAEAGP